MAPIEASHAGRGKGLGIGHNSVNVGTQINFVPAGHTQQGESDEKAPTQPKAPKVEPLSAVVRPRGTVIGYVRRNGDKTYI